MKNLFSQGQVDKAVELMSELGIAPCISGAVAKRPMDFARDFFSESFSNPKLRKKIDELQEHYGAMVYYVTHDMMFFGECYTLYYVSKYPEDWVLQSVRKTAKGDFAVHAYVWNVTRESCSEFGTVVVRNGSGLLVRVA